MDYDSFRTAGDAVVRDGADFEAYRRPGDLIDSEHPKIVAYARGVAGEGADRERALRLYYAVRDDLRYDPYNTPMKREAYRASTTLAPFGSFTEAVSDTRSCTDSSSRSRLKRSVCARRSLLAAVRCGRVHSLLLWMHDSPASRWSISFSCAQKQVATHRAVFKHKQPPSDSERCKP